MTVAGGSSVGAIVCTERWHRMTNRVDDLTDVTTLVANVKT